MNKTLSFCCVGYNHAKFIKENLDSIEKINYEDKEVVILDDGSTDDTKQVLEAIQNQYTFPIHVILQSNSGNIGKNFNTVFKQSTGTFITYISLDDIFNPEIIEDELKLIQKSNDIAFVASSKVSTIDEQKNFREDLISPLALHKLVNPSVQDLLELEFNEFGAFYLQGSIIRRNIIDKVNGFDEDMIGDDIVLRTKIFRYLSENPHLKFDIINENNVFYRIHSTNIHKNVIRQIKIVTEYLERYWPNRILPQLLFAWMEHVVNSYPLNEVYKIQEFNSVGANLMQSPQIIKRIRLKEKYQKSLFRKYIFRKERHDKSRVFVFFNLIKFTYTKKR